MSTEIVGGLPATQSEMDLLLELDHEHRAVEECLTDALAHALRAGEILLTFRERHDEGGWMKWVRQNAPCSQGSVDVYMRLARYREQIPAGASIKEARRLLIGAPPANPSGRPPSYSKEIKERALSLVAEGWSQARAGEEVGVTQGTVWSWIHASEQLRAKKRADSARSATRKKAAKEQAKAQAIKRAARKVGGARHKAYAAAERFQDIIAAAHREATDKQEREHWAEAGVLQRKMRDEIVRAFGVQ